MSGLAHDHHKILDEQYENSQISNAPSGYYNICWPVAAEQCWLALVDGSHNIQCKSS